MYEIYENREQRCFPFAAFLPIDFGVSGFLLDLQKKNFSRSIDWYWKILVSSLAAWYLASLENPSKSKWDSPDPEILSNIYWALSKCYRNSTENLSTFDWSSLEIPLTSVPVAIETLSKFYPSSIDMRLNIYRPSIEHLLKSGWVSIETLQKSVEILVNYYWTFIEYPMKSIQHSIDTLLKS